MTDRLNTFYAAHNEYLEQLLSTGLLGLAGWLIFVVSHLRRGFARWADARVAALLLALCSYLVQAVVSIRVSMIFPEVMLLFALLAAFTAPVPEQPESAPALRLHGKKKRKKRAARPAGGPHGPHLDHRHGGGGGLDGGGRRAVPSVLCRLVLKKHV